MQKIQIVEEMTSINKVELLSFRPIPGFSSPHVQTILGTFSKTETPPPSTPFIVLLDDGDSIYCEISTPPSWTPNQKTILMIHGMGGSHEASYMVRIGGKFYRKGYQVVRVNLRGCGAGLHLARRPYHGGSSQDVLNVLQALHKQNPLSPVILLGFSLGGNIALKLAGELSSDHSFLFERMMAVCPPIDIAHTIHLLSRFRNKLYHRYYVRGLRKLCSHWLGNRKISSITDFDNAVTAPCWGFEDAQDYYQQCSSYLFLPRIRNTCHILFSRDDPFIDYRHVLQKFHSPSIKIWLSQYGGHMGFLGWAGKEHRYYWLDSFLLDWIVRPLE